MMLYASSFVGLILIICAHLFVRRTFEHPKREDFLLNISAGVAIAYAFVDVFPHLASMQARLEYVSGPAWFDYHAHRTYLMALFGFMVYFGVRASLFANGRDEGIDQKRLRYAFLVLSMCLYNFLIGYMLSEQPTHRVAPALLFGMAMAAHLLGLNYSNREPAPEVYDRLVRWLFVASVSVGWISGYLFEMSDAVYALWFAYLAGGIVAAGLATELPRIQTMREFAAFSAGAILFCVLILMLEAGRGS